MFRAGAGALAVLALLFGTAGPVESSTPTYPCVQQRVGLGYYRSSPATFATADFWVYGDSITYQHWRHLTGSFAVDARWGRATSPTVTILGQDKHRWGAPKVVVMELGTNDVQNPGAMGAKVALARAVLPRTTRLVWVNVYADTTPAWAAVNAQIASVPGVEVADWASLVLRSRARGVELLDSSGFHLSCAGALYRTAQVQSAVARGVVTRPYDSSRIGWTR